MRTVRRTFLLPLALIRKKRDLDTKSLRYLTFGLNHHTTFQPPRITIHKDLFILIKSSLRSLIDEDFTPWMNENQ